MKAIVSRLDAAIKATKDLEALLQDSILGSPATFTADFLPVVNKKLDRIIGKMSNVDIVRSRRNDMPRLELKPETAQLKEPLGKSWVWVEDKNRAK